MESVVQRGVPSPVAPFPPEGGAGARTSSVKITHVWSGNSSDPETARRMAVAQSSWKREAVSYGNWQEIDFSTIPTVRNATALGDPVALPLIHDMIDACLDCEDTDIILITNADIGFYHGIAAEIIDVCREKAACFAYRWDFPRVETLPVFKKDVGAGKAYVGCDLFAFTKKWWLDNRHDIPPFILGRECWDWIMRAKIVETKGGELTRAIWHEKHDSPWKKNRAMHPGNIWNRSYARAWLNLRKMDLREITHAPFRQVQWPPEGAHGTPVSGAAPRSTGAIDVLYVLGHGSKWENNELKYSLRSLEKYGKNVGRVFVIGQDPGFLSAEVTVVHRPDAGKNKEHNIADHIAYAAAKLPITEHFLWINDDFFFLKDTDIATYPYYTAGELAQKVEGSQKSGYRAALAQAEAQLKARRFPTKNFEVHVPMIFSRAAMGKLGGWLSISSKLKFGMTWRSIYANVIGVKPGPAYKDVKIGTANTVGELKHKIEGLSLFSIGDGLSDEAKAYFDELYPDKCRYET